MLRSACQSQGEMQISCIDQQQSYNMSLLDQLAFYSCKFDSLFPELTNYLPNHTKNTKANQINYQTPLNMSEKSEKSFTTDFSSTTSIFILEQQQAKLTNTKEDMVWIQKCSRLSWIGSMIEKKVIKLKYVFFIYLTNLKGKKSFQSQKRSIQKLSCLFSPKTINSRDDKKVQKKENMQFIVNEINEANFMSSNKKPTRNQLRREIRQAKNIIIKQLKALPQTPKQQMPLISHNSFQAQVFSFENAPQSSVQMKQVENPDLSDFVHIFIKDEIQKIGNKTQLSLNSDHLSHISQSDLQKQLRNSHLKRFQELQFTALPLSSQSKRRLSHTTIVSGIFSQSVWMGSQEQRQKMLVERKSSLKEDILQQIKGKESILVNNEKQFTQLQSSQYEGQRKEKSIMLINESKISQQHNKDLDLYIQFKRNIERRRQSTLKQIQNSQQIIAKLIKSFKVSKKPQSAKKYQIQKSKDKSYSSIKKMTSSKSKSTSKNRIAMKGNPSDFSSNAIKDIFSERYCDLYQQQTSTKTIQVFCNYVKQKQKMDQKRQSPHKTNNSSIAPKKQKKDSKKVDGLLQSCKNVSKKQPRIKLKVELFLKSVKQKQQLKNKTKKNRKN